MKINRFNHLFPTDLSVSPEQKVMEKQPESTGRSHHPVSILIHPPISIAFATRSSLSLRYVPHKRVRYTGEIYPASLFSQKKTTVTEKKAVSVLFFFNLKRRRLLSISGAVTKVDNFQAADGEVFCFVSLFSSLPTHFSTVFSWFHWVLRKNKPARLETWEDHRPLVLLFISGSLGGGERGSLFSFFLNLVCLYFVYGVGVRDKGLAF